MAEQRLVKLRSATRELFEVDEAVALQSEFLKSVIEDVGVESPIPLPNVSTRTLGQLLHFCKWYAQNQCMQRNDNLLEAPEEDLHELDVESVSGLIMAADYMHIESLIQWSCRAIARMIAKRTFGEIQQIINFNNEFARAKRRLMGTESQILASLMEALPTELQLNIKIKVGQSFYYGNWSPWRYDAEAQVLVVGLANLYNASLNTRQHIAIKFVDPMDEDLLEDLLDGIDGLKIEAVIFDEERNHPLA